MFKLRNSLFIPKPILVVLQMISIYRITETIYKQQQEQLDIVKSKYNYDKRQVISVDKLQQIAQDNPIFTLIKSFRSIFITLMIANLAHFKMKSSF